MNQTVEFKIVLLHEDLVSGLRASSILERLAGQLELGAAQLDTEIWRFEKLQRAKARAEAIAPLIEAKMIIISAAGHTDLPAHVKDVIEQALFLRPDREAAIVALLDWEQSPSPTLPKLGEYLRDLAVKMRMDFFCNKSECEAPLSAPAKADAVPLPGHSDEAISMDA